MNTRPPIDHRNQTSLIATSAVATARPWRCLTAVLGVLGCAIAVAACGSSSTSKAAASGSANSDFEAARCMRAHSVPNFPDPTTGPGGEGFSISVPVGGSASVTVNGITFSGPAFQSAAKTCHLSTGPAAPLSEPQKQAFVAKAHCLRTHGAPNFPDPSFGPGGHGVGINLTPGFNPQSPAFRNAAKMCASVGANLPGVP